SFIVSSLNLTRENGHIGFMSPYVWMFISSHEKLRNKIITDSTISSLIQLEYSGFEGATVPICTFTLRNNSKEIPGEYIRLSDFVGAKQQPIKTKEAVASPDVTYRYTFNQNNFKEVPGNPIAYWASDNLISNFQDGKKMGDLVDARLGLQTGNTNLFLRLWWEPKFEHINFTINSMDETYVNETTWIPLNKGGKKRDWYGNYDYLIYFKNSGKDVSEYR